MIYSQWDPTRGDYVYYETAEVYGLNDDLPKPQQPAQTSPIGIAAIAIGRPVPSSAREVGRGELARGVVAINSKVAVHGQLMGGDVAAKMMTLQHVLMGTALGAALTWVYMTWRKR
jgi:hypothetical protein